MVEQSTVNRLVPGSSPGRGATCRRRQLFKNRAMEDKMTRKELMQDLNGLFQFAVTVSLLFLTVMEFLLKSANMASDQMSLAELKWVSVPIFLVMSYVLFRIFKRKYRDWVFKTTNILLLIEIVLIVIAIIVVMINGNGVIHSYITLFILSGSLWGTAILPVLIFLFLAASTLFKKQHP
jgi:glucose uptake protein GlcU